MKLVVAAMAAAAVLGLAACSSTTTINPAAPPPRSGTPSAPASSARPAPTVTRTHIKTVPAPARTPPPTPNVSDPWAVVSAYYGDIESGNYPEAWALLSSGAVTGQTYQQFVAGFACTGSQQLTEVSESGDQVTFQLEATDDCTGAVQHYAGTDTVSDGKIVAADVHLTG